MSYATSVIKSIQRGTISITGTSATATITSVSTAKSAVAFLGFQSNSYSIDAPSVTLTNATTVTATRSVGTNTSICGYQVVEYY